MKKELQFTILSFILLSFLSINAQKKGWEVPKDIKELENPYKNQSFKKVVKIFKTRCKVCHGVEGKGDGVGTTILNSKPKDLTLSSVQSQTDGEIFWKITNGKNPMIKWEPILTEKQRWELVNYIRSL